MIRYKRLVCLYAVVRFQHLGIPKISISTLSRGLVATFERQAFRQWFIAEEADDHANPLELPLARPQQG
jgi:hypothetical protein